MKKILFALVLSTLFSLLAFAAGEPGYLLAPCEADPLIPDSRNGCNLLNCDTYLKVVSIEDLNEGKNGDPYFNVNADLDAKYEWIKFRVKNLSEATQFEFHFASTATADKVSADACTHFPISSGDTEYKEYIYNIKSANLASQNVNEDVKLEKSVWDGKISVLRFDCMWKAEPSGQMPKGSTMEIDYIAFFETEEDAKAFVPPVKEVKEPIDFTGVEWAKDSPHFITSDEEEMKKWSPGGVNVTYEFGNMLFVPTGRDPTLTRSFEESFSAEEFPYFAYRYKAESFIPNGGFFFTNEYETKLSDRTYSNFDILYPGEWTNLVMDMREMPHGNWKGNITLMRLDALNGSVADLDARVLINRLGFFRTEEEAYAFLAEGTSENYSGLVTFRDISYKAIIPGNTLSEGYNEADYVLSAEVENVGENPVVMKTTADGTTSIVALSHVNEYGYVAYVANQPATYTVGQNHKEYVDIAGHWGESYINFVSDRTLFGGTSPTEFSPDLTMTRGMFITVLGRMHGLDTSKYDGNTGYTDVAATEYYAPYIQWAKELGIMAGTSEATFAPEEPITRATMAVAINNYTDKSGFKFTIYQETEGFNDLAGLDEATVNAINTVKNVGIINGKGEGRFDPNGISTRAEVATVMERVIKCVLGVNVPAGAYDAEYFTKDKIRIGVWGFQSNLATQKGMKDLADLGANLIVNGSAAIGLNGETVLNYGDLYGIEVYMNDHYTVSASATNMKEFAAERDPKKISAGYMHHPSFTGHYITDEPGTDFFEGLGTIIDSYESQMPGKRAFVNLLPMYANAAQLKFGASAAAIEYYDSDPELYRKHCQTWFETNNTDYICTDIYPLNWVGSMKTTYNEYIESINQIASVAREEDKEFWCCIQTYGWTQNKRTPTEAEYRWQSYCMLSFGCTGILLWQYFTSNVNFPALIDPVTLNPNDAYYACRPVMWELRDISDTYVQYKYVGTYTVNATKPYQMMTNPYAGLEGVSVESSNAILVGCFEKKDGSGAKAITLVNMEEFQGDIPAKATLKVDPSKKVTIYKYGKPEVVANNGTIAIDFNSGDGFFITIE